MTTLDLMRINVSSLSEKERLNLIRAEKPNLSILTYLHIKLKYLSITIGRRPKRNIFELMNSGWLEGWCWQTTESAIVFFNDDDYIERGNLCFGYYKADPLFFKGTLRKNYWHAWICFSYNNDIWVFDPCLRIIVKKEIYYHVFEITEAEGKVTAKAVREELIYKINTYKPEYTCLPKDIVMIDGGENDVNAPLYRNGVGYTATLENGSIKALTARYYFSG